MKQGLAPRVVPVEVNGTRALGLLLAQSVWTLIMTVLPVVLELPTVAGSPHKGWYVGDDVIRFLEPLLTLPLTFALLYESPLFWEHGKCCQWGAANAARPGVVCRRPMLAAAAFMIASALYQQGAAHHSAFTMMKDPVLDMLTWQGLSPERRLWLDELFFWMKETMQHVVAHYMYAFGGMLVSFVFQFVFRDWYVKGGLKGGTLRSLFVANMIIYGIIIAAVAIQYPSGTIVGLIFIVLYGFCVLLTCMFFQNGRSCSFFKTWGEHPILHIYMGAYIIALVIIVLWVISQRGFKSRS